MAGGAGSILTTEPPEYPEHLEQVGTRYVGSIWRRHCHTAGKGGMQFWVIIITAWQLFFLRYSVRYWYR